MKRNSQIAIKSLRGLGRGLCLVTLFVLFSLVGQLTNIQTAFAGVSAQAEKCSAVFGPEGSSKAGNFADRARKSKVGNTFELKFEDDGDGFSQVREEYKQELKKIKWTKLLPNLPEVREQCSMNVCHAMVWLDYLEYEANRNGAQGRQFNGYVSIDQDYLAMKHWERSTEALIRMPLYPKQGVNNKRKTDKLVRMNVQMNLQESWKFIGRVGLMPEGIVNWKYPFKMAQYQDRTNAVLENLAARVRLAAEKETVALSIGPIFDQGVEAGLNYLHQAYGQAPTAFRYDGKTYDPISFLRSVFPAYRPDIMMTHIFYHRELDSGNFGLHSNRPDMKIFAFNQQYIESTIKSRIDKMKMPIPLDLHIHKAYLDKDNGVFTIGGWAHGEAMKHPTPQERDQIGMKFPGHAVLIVGYYENPQTGRIEKLKIKNSWGKAAGDKGYFIVDMDYFYEFMERMTIPGDPMIPVPDLKPIP